MTVLHGTRGGPQNAQGRGRRGGRAGSLSLSLPPQFLGTIPQDLPTAMNALPMLAPPARALPASLSRGPFNSSLPLTSILARSSFHHKFIMEPPRPRAGSGKKWDNDRPRPSVRGTDTHRYRHHGVNRLLLAAN